MDCLHASHQSSNKQQQQHHIDVLVATPGRLVDLMQSYSENDDSKTSSTRTRQSAPALDSVLEQRLLNAMDKKDILSLEEIQALQLDTDDGNTNYDTGGGSSTLLTLLQQFDYLILDEADRLLGRGFESEMDGVLQFLAPVRSNNNNNNKICGTWMFSATPLSHQMEPRVNSALGQILGVSSRSSSALPPMVRISCTNSNHLSTDDGDDGDNGYKIIKPHWKSATAKLNK
jgi:hypothetical protein